jgi:glucose 1-dehydrogenase
MPSFVGRAAVVTGAAHGIGRGTAELLVRLGARVIALDRDERALADVFRDGRCIRCPGDIAGDRVEQLADEIWSRDGPIDLLVNNVGIDQSRSFFEVDADDFDETFDTNLRGPWFFTKRFAQHLNEERRGGAIVFVSSLHDHIVGTHPHYSASKAAVSMLVKELASELAPHRIRVNAVSPGAIRSAANPLSDDSPMRALVPLGRVGEPDDVARMVAILLSEEWCGYVTGVNVPVDGGLGLSNWRTVGKRRPPEHGVRRVLHRRSA